MPPADRTAGLRVGVVGATGMVGQELLVLLERGSLPISHLRPFSSGASKKTVRFRGRTIDAPAPDERFLRDCHLIFFVSADAVSKRLSPRLAARGSYVIDDSAAFRLDPRVPLVIPEVNASALRARSRLIAGPNCTMAGLAVAAHPLHLAGRVREVRLASYQSVSGAGKAAVEELFSQARARAPRLALERGRAPVLSPARSQTLPRAIAFNVIPQVGRFDKEGSSSEETKVAAELRKVWSAPSLKVSATAVRVPVVRGHALAVWVTLSRPMTPGRARALLSRAPGVALARGGGYPTPLDSAGRAAVFVGRLRAGAGANELALWIVSDNLLKGAALNSVQIAEHLLRRRWLSF